jgi:IS5 family transposase
MSQVGCFDLSDHLKRLSDASDHLAALVDAVDFEVLRAVLDIALDDSDGSNGGRPPDDPVAMFKALILTAQNNVSDERMTFLIRDRFSWLVDATRVSAPRQRNNDAQKPAQAAQQDTDARWTVKFSKATIKDVRSVAVTNAAKPDGQVLRQIVTRDNTGSGVWADTDYRCKAHAVLLDKIGRTAHIHHKQPQLTTDGHKQHRITTNTASDATIVTDYRR